jgi:hypothetical protein
MEMLQKGDPEAERVCHQVSNVHAHIGKARISVPPIIFYMLCIAFERVVV